MSEQPRIWHIAYDGIDLALTYDEYDELKRMSHDDPPRAERLAIGYLAREKREGT